jgi:hypothetical protein
MYAHHKLINIVEKLGYLGFNKADAVGICQGITMRWIEACLGHEEDIFNQRITRMLSTPDLAGEIKRLQKKMHNNPQNRLTPDELDLLDMQAFVESVVIYHLPQQYRTLFNRPLSQDDTRLLSFFAASKQTEDSGGLVSVYSECGIYTQQEIQTYLDELAQAIDEAQCPAETNIGLRLTNHNHAIGLIYNTSSKSWALMNINTWEPPLDSPRPPLALTSAELAVQILQGFNCFFMSAMNA